MAFTIPTTMATPAWSAADGKRFLALEAEFNKTSWPFTVAGSIPLEDLEGLGLYYSRPPVDNQTDCDPNWSLNVNRMRKKLQQHPHRLPARARMQNRNIDFVATTKFDVFSGQRDLGWGLDVLANIINDSRAYIDPIWVTKPVHFDMSNRYTTYGNEVRIWQKRLC